MDSPEAIPVNPASTKRTNPGRLKVLNVKTNFGE
jgi:hypothetical protein